MGTNDSKLTTLESENISEEYVCDSLESPVTLDKNYQRCKSESDSIEIKIDKFLPIEDTTTKSSSWPFDSILVFNMYIVSAFKNFSQKINPRLLTGAIDLLVIKQPDGTYESTPLHIIFGKLGVLMADKTEIRIEVNDEPVNGIEMYLNRHGVGYLLKENDDTACNDEVQSNQQTESTLKDTYMSTQSKLNYFSDGDLTPDLASPDSSRPSSPKSDTEIDKIKKKEDDWTWNEISNKSQVNKPSEKSSLFGGLFKAKKSDIKEGGVYLDDAEKLDGEVAALYGLDKKEPIIQQQQQAPQLLITRKEEDQESGNGHSLPQSPVRSLHLLGDLQLSLCGASDMHDQTYDDLFQTHLVTYEKFLLEIASILQNPNLVVKLNNQYYNWQTAAPILISTICFNRQLPNDVISQIQKPATQLQTVAVAKEQQRTWSFWSSKKKETTMSTSASSNANLTSTSVATKTASITQIVPEQLQATTSSTTTTITQTAQVPQLVRMNSEHPNRTNRLTSKQIKSMKLKEGYNKITYSVTNAFQGTTTIESCVFLWNHDDKIIVSDIDGTITKSDVGGQVLPIIGFDWTQSGVANLYTAIENNSYKFIYLSSRAIGQATITRNYIGRINQNGYSLPEGPLLVSPAPLFEAFYKEVIERKPEEFKIRCLSDIKSLFPSDSNPFYAGYGNRPTDVKSYKAVGIPQSHIFTINHKGELKNEISQTFQTSYSKLVDYVDQIFPPVKIHVNREYTSFNYWKTPLPSLEIVDQSSLAEKQSKSNETTKKMQLLTNPISFIKYSSSTNLIQENTSTLSNEIQIKKSDTLNDISLAATLSKSL